MSDPARPGDGSPASGSPAGQLAEQRRKQAASFGAAAAAYERGRPPYPAEAVDWLLPDGASRVLDLGAGTGKLTRQLAGLGLEVIAVEPSAAMREQLAGAVPGVPALAGTAESIPLPDGSVDAVLVAQAWHWVDRARAVPEVARVLVPGGRLGLLWNLRDEQQDWVARLSRILHDPAEHRAAERGLVGPPFGPVQRREVRWQHQLSVAQLTDMAASRSYVITMPPGQREAVLAAVRQLGEERLAGSGTGQLTLPYVTECYRADLG